MAIDSDTVIGQLKILNGATSKVEQNTNPIPPPSQTIPIQKDRSIAGTWGGTGQQFGVVIGKYLVPQRCKAHVELVSMTMMRETAATTVGESQLIARFGAWQGGGGTITLSMINNTVGGGIQQTSSPDFWLYGGNRLEVGNDAAGDNTLGSGGSSYAVLVYYTDLSAGATLGTMEYDAWIKIREYDY